VAQQCGLESKDLKKIINIVLTSAATVQMQKSGFNRPAAYKEMDSQWLYNVCFNKALTSKHFLTSSVERADGEMLQAKYRHGILILQFRLRLALVGYHRRFQRRMNFRKNKATWE
jgi:hypothetical protein